jgi:hypothetical protein
MLSGGGVFSQLTVLRPDASDSEALDFLDPLAERIGPMCRGMIWGRRKWYRCQWENISLRAHYFYGFIGGKCAMCAASLSRSQV